MVSTTIAAGSNGQILPQSIINVAATAGFPSSGIIYVGITTTISAASNNTALPQATINVASNAGFPASGTILVYTTAGVQTVTYTSLGVNTFAGCSGGTGTMFTNNSVTTNNGIQTVTYTGTTATTFTGCTGGVGTLVTSETVALFPTINDEYTIFSTTHLEAYRGQYTGSQGNQDLSNIFINNGVYDPIVNVEDFNTTSKITTGFNIYWKMEGFNPVSNKYETWHSMGTPLLIPPSGNALQNISILTMWIDR